MSFTIKIVDNDDGRVVMDESNAKGILGAVAREDGIVGIYSTSCNAMECAGIVYCAKNVVNMAIKKNPKVAMMVALAETQPEGIEKTEIDLSDIRKAQKGEAE